MRTVLYWVIITLSADTVLSEDEDTLMFGRVSRPAINIQSLGVFQKLFTTQESSSALIKGVVTPIAKTEICLFFG